MEESDPRRRFPRIFLVGMHDLRELTGAKVEWSNAQRTDVLDMSYSGLAVVRPSGLEFEKGKELKIKMLFSGLEPLQMEIQLIRETEKIFGARFVNLSKPHIDAMDKFLSDKILGRNLRKVNPKFFHAKHDFNHWLHGPNNTNLYIWQDSNSKIKKAVLELNGVGILYDGKFSLQKVDHQAEEEDFIVFPLQSKANVKTTLPEALNRALKVLSQVEEAPRAVWELIDIIKEHNS